MLVACVLKYIFSPLLDRLVQPNKGKVKNEDNLNFLGQIRAGAAAVDGWLGVLGWCKYCSIMIQAQFLRDLLTQLDWIQPELGTSPSQG